MRTNDILKSLRQDKKLTQAEAAEQLGVSLSSYQKYERDKNSVMPSIEVLSKMADFYGVSIDYLVGREQKPEPYYHEGLEDGLKEIYQKLPRDVRANILQAMLDAVLSYQRQGQQIPGAEQMQEVCRTVLLKYYADAASAGTGEPLSDDPEEEIEVLETPEALAADCVIRINGDSMMPAFVDGDLALVRYQETVEPGQVGVFIKNGEGYIKELGEGALISLNWKYKDIPLFDTDDVRCTGLVIGTAQRPQWCNR